MERVLGGLVPRRPVIRVAPLALVSLLILGMTTPAKLFAGHPPTGIARAESPTWYKSPEWALVAVGIATLVLIWYQARETARTTKAMRASTELQEVRLRQWVQLRNWQNTRRVSGDASEQRTLDIEFEIVNPTKMPLSLRSIRVSIGQQRTEHDETIVMVPDEAYTYILPIALDLEQDKQYCEAKLVFAVRGSIVSVDALGKWRDQSFTGLLACNKTGTMFRPEAISPLSAQGESRSQSPSQDARG
jgi:hypothetical protein